MATCAAGARRWSVSELSVAPAAEHPAKYYFAGAPQAGAAASLGSPSPPAAPAYAGATVLL